MQRSLLPAARLLAALTFINSEVAGCGGGAEDVGVDGGSVKGSGDAGSGWDSAAAPDNAGSLCPLNGFSPCGGAVEGTWKLVDFCDLEGQAASRPRACDGPGGNQPACQGGSNAGTCRTLYRVTAEIGPDDFVLTTGLFASFLYTFDDACLAAIGGGAAAPEACLALAKPDRGLTCAYQSGQCRCEGTSTEPLQAGTDTAPYTRDGNRITLRPGPDMATGTYCVVGNRLSIQFDQVGFQGWRSWILER